MRTRFLLAAALFAASVACAQAQDVANPQTNASALTSGTLNAARLPFSAGVIANSLGANVALNNTALFFDGPSVAQGSTGTWCATGTVTVFDTAIANIVAKLHDGTTTISSAQSTVMVASKDATITLSGCLAAPAGNIRISVKDVTNTTGSIEFNDTGLSKDSTITAWRVQ